MDQSLIGALDVRLMRTLLILLTECSVSKTAKILEQTQPSVSLSLRRLRAILNDPLLVRSGGNLVPTERGIELREPLRRILDDIDRHMGPAPDFDPASSERVFNIVSKNCLGMVFIPRILESVRAECPRASVRICQPPKLDQLVPLLASGQIDVAIANWPNPPDALRMAPLITTDIVCLVGPRHPLARTRALTMEQYLELDHVSPSGGQSAIMTPIGGRLHELNLVRRIAATVPEYGVVPDVLARTDLVFTTGRPFAERLASLLPFSILEAPREFGAMKLYMLWHDRTHRSPAHRWLRDVIRQVADEYRAIELGSDEDVAVRPRITSGPHLPPQLAVNDRMD